MRSAASPPPCPGLSPRSRGMAFPFSPVVAADKEMAAGTPRSLPSEGQAGGEERPHRPSRHAERCHRRGASGLLRRGRGRCLLLLLLRIPLHHWKRYPGPSQRREAGGLRVSPGKDRQAGPEGCLGHCRLSVHQPAHELSRADVMELNLWRWPPWTVCPPSPRCSAPAMLVEGRPGLDGNQNLLSSPSLGSDIVGDTLWLYAVLLTIN